MIFDNIAAEFDDVKEIIARFGMFAPIAAKREPLGTSHVSSIFGLDGHESKRNLLFLSSAKRARSKPEAANSFPLEQIRISGIPWRWELKVLNSIKPGKK